MPSIITLNNFCIISRQIPMFIVTSRCSFPSAFSVRSLGAPSEPLLYLCGIPTTCPTQFHRQREVSFQLKINRCAGNIEPFGYFHYRKKTIFSMDIRHS